MSTKTIIDLTHTFTQEMPVFSGDTPPKLEEGIDHEQAIVHYHIDSSMHVGTHMDGPLHMLAGGRKLSEISVEKFIANGHILDARGKESIDVDLLDGINIHPCDCVLVYTGFDQKFRDASFYRDYPIFTENFAKRLVELRVAFVGSDTPSPDKAPYQIHRVLLREEILIIEGLCNLGSLVGVSTFEVIALPTKFDAEAAPVRVVARIGE